MTRNNPWIRGAAPLALAFWALSSVPAQAFSVIRANTVVPVVFEDELNVRNNRRGDRFHVRVDESRELPRGTRMEGVVRQVSMSRDGRPASMDVEFTNLILPDGERTAITAIPVNLDSRSVQRGPDGRLTADPKKVKSEHYVIGGAVGGLLFGSLIKKPFEGAFLGTLAGILIGESERKSRGNGDIVVRRGAKMGAFFEREVRVGDRYGRDDQYDRDDRYDRDRSDRMSGNDRFGGQDRDERDDREVQSDRFDQDIERLPYGRRAGDLDLRYAGRQVRFSDDARPYQNGDTWMVPLERTATQLGLRLETSGRIFYVEDEDSILRLEQETAGYRLNNRRGNLAQPVIKRGGEWFVPLEILAAAADEKVQANGKAVSVTAYRSEP